MADPTLPSEAELAAVEAWVERGCLEAHPGCWCRSCEKRSAAVAALPRLIAAARAVRSGIAQCDNERSVSHSNSRSYGQGQFEAAVRIRAALTGAELRAELEKQRAVVEAALAWNKWWRLRTEGPEREESSRQSLLKSSYALSAACWVLASAGSEPNRAGGESEPAECRSCDGEGWVIPRSQFDDGVRCRDCRGTGIAPATEEPAPKQGEADPIAGLADLLDQAGARVMFDRGRDITKPCTFCGKAPETTHDLRRIGTYPNGTALTRPVCAGCKRVGDAIEEAFSNAPAGVPVERVEALRDAVHQAIQEAARVASPKLVAIRTELNIMLGIEPAEYSELLAKPDAGGGG